MNQVVPVTQCRKAQLLDQLLMLGLKQYVRDLIHNNE